MRRFLIVVEKANGNFSAKRLAGAIVSGAGLDREMRSSAEIADRDCRRDHPRHPAGQSPDGPRVVSRPLWLLGMVILLGGGLTVLIGPFVKAQHFYDRVSPAELIQSIRR